MIYKRMMAAGIVSLVALLVAAHGNRAMTAELDCSAIIALPENSESTTNISGKVDVDGFARRLLSGDADATYLNETKKTLQQYPLDKQSLACSQLMYLVCGKLNIQPDISLSEVVDALSKLNGFCGQITSGILTNNTDLMPVSSDERFIWTPILCQKKEGNISCSLYVQSVGRDRQLSAGRQSVEIVDDKGITYNASSFRLGQANAGSLNYEFKADTKTYLEFVFKNVDRSSDFIQTLTAEFVNRTDRDDVSLRYRNIQVR